MTNPPASPARALHDILAQVQSTSEKAGGSTWEHWESVANAGPGGADFARFHAETMELLSEVEEALGTLSQTAQERYDKYLPEWWTALVQPRSDWQTTRGIIGPSDLDHLASLADVLEAKAGPVVDPQAHVILRRAIDLVIAEVEQDTALPANIREEILTDLRHVLWLLSEVNTFGVDHAVAAAEKTLGKIAARAVRTGSDKLKRAVIMVAAALTLASGGVRPGSRHRDGPAAGLWNHGRGGNRGAGRRGGKASSSKSRTSACPSS